MTRLGELPYLRAWRRLPRNLAYLLAGLPVAVAGFVVVVTLIVTGAALTIIWVGIPIGVAGLVVARGFGGLELIRLAAAGQAPIAQPDWRRPRATGIVRRLLAIIADGRYWVRAVYVAPVDFALSIVSWVFAVVWSVGALGGVSYWFWERFLPRPGPDNLWLHAVVWHFFDRGYTVEPTLAGRIAGESVLFALVGVILLLTLPAVAGAFVAAHHGVARGMLGERRSAQFERLAREAESSRESAVIAEDRSLRRLERDIHDGPQQRLIRLQFDLASAKRRLADDPAAAGELIDGALTQAKDALDELRELSRGFAPPILQDRGLEAALRSLAARSPLPTTVEIDLRGAAPALADLERSVYFIASELLSNASKHARAARATVTLTVGDDGQSLALLVTDDGRGGAAETPGHGLAGVRERLAGLRGALTVSSPAGGPTTVAARIPLAHAHE